MKRYLAPIVSILIVHCALAADREYTEVTHKQLEIDAKSYKNKYVQYESTYVRVSSTFLPYIEKSGYRTDRHIWITIGGNHVPVMAKRTDELIAFLAELKAGQNVKVYGKVKEFQHEPGNTMFPRYHVYADKIELLPGTAKQEALQNKEEPLQTPRKPRRRRFFK